MNNTKVMGYLFADEIFCRRLRLTARSGKPYNTFASARRKSLPTFARKFLIVCSQVSPLLIFVGLMLTVSHSALADSPSLEGFRMEDAVINVAETAGKAVVSISTEHITRMRGSRVYPFDGTPFAEDEFFRQFFQDFFGEIPEREFKQMGLGSGVIIDSEGYILTNEHVVGNADKISVTLSDGRAFKGQVKGLDPRSDLAVIKINARNLPFIRLGDSDALKIGQWVVAIGNPFAFVMENPEPTVTAGVISALHRSLGKALAQGRDYSDLIQTDAAINPGNSGGPLVNLKGEIVGINVAIFSTSGGYQGIGFAIPINHAKRIISQLISGKKIAYGWLGIAVQDLNQDLVQYFGLDQAGGVLVAQVFPASPAQACGLKAGDIIKQLGGRVVNNTRELLSIVGQSEVGSRLKMSIRRNRQTLLLEAVVGRRPEDGQTEPVARPEVVPQGEWRGMTVVETSEGVLVAKVFSGSPADAAGIVRGDIIIEINKQPISSLSDYKNAVGGFQGDALVRTNRGYFLVRD
jgi:serine protease Do